MPGRAATRQVTLVNEGNLFENNEIHGFGYGIASVGDGPIFRTQSSRFEAVTNRTNTYRDNEIHNVSRAGGRAQLGAQRWARAVQLRVGVERPEHSVGSDTIHVRDDRRAVRNGACPTRR